jgi:hypothetical protein
MSHFKILPAIFALAIPLSATAQVHRPTPHPPIRRMRRDPHVALHHAMAKLIAAKHDLQQARSEYKGHRGAAILAIDNAMREIDLALKSDHK